MYCKDKETSNQISESLLDAKVLQKKFILIFLIVP